MVWLKNGATISYARNAITTSKYDEYWNDNYYGGIIIATDANFLNNRRSIEFLQFDYYKYNTDDDNISEFKRCLFEVDNTYPCAESFPYHVSLWDVDGIEFIANDFKDSRTTCNNESEGVFSVDATFTVKGELCGFPPPGGCVDDYNTFDGFFRAIHVANTIFKPRPIEISHAHFYSAIRGVLFSNVQNSLIHSSIFEISDLSADNCYGIYLENSKGYQIEGNYFTNDGGYDNAQPFNAGIYVVNNSNAATELYRNTFENLEAGIRVQQNNTKLQIKCNDFLTELSKFDVLVSTSGLLGNQGRCLTILDPIEDRMRSPGGNEFTHDCNSTESDFRIPSGHPELKYRHHDNATYTPLCYTNTPITFITLQTCDDLDPSESEFDPCPSFLPGEGMEAMMAGGGSSLEALAAYYSSISTALNDLEILLEAIDGVDAENEDIQWLKWEQEISGTALIDAYLVNGLADSALVFLSTCNTDWASFMEIELLYALGQFEEAEVNLKSLDSFTEDEADFKTLYTVLLAAAIDQRNLMEFTEKEWGTMGNLAGKQSPAGVAAENLILLVSGQDYPEVFDEDVIAETFRLNAYANSNEIFIYPNPATNDIYVTLPETELDYSLVFYDLTGKIAVKQFVVPAGFHVIPLGDLSPGIYMFQILLEGNVLWVNKQIKL